MLTAKVAELRRSGKDIISLNIGEPNFPTPDKIKEAAFEAIRNNFTQYPPSGGYPELRGAIARKLARDNGAEYQPSEISVSNGAKQAIYNALLATAGAGNEVIIPTPCWVSYTEMVKLAGAVPVTVPVDENNGYQLDLKAIENAVTSKTSAIIICTPNNPTGAVYSEENLRKVSELAIKHDFFVISDEIYEKLIYDGAKHISIASFSREAREHTITVNGVSKAYAMTGWRIGYSAAPELIAKAINAFQSQTTSGACSISQKASYVALSGSENVVEAMRNEYDARRKLMIRMLNDIPGVHCENVQGAFYLFPDVTELLEKCYNGKELKTSMNLAEYLLDTANIAVVPGEAFDGPGKLRISYSNSLSNLEKAMKRFKESVARLNMC